jgi:hypothetical protein
MRKVKTVHETALQCCHTVDDVCALKIKIEHHKKSSQVKHVMSSQDRSVM